MRDLVSKTLDKITKEIKEHFNLSIRFDLVYDLKGTCTIGQCKKVDKLHYIIRLHEPLLNHYKNIYIDDVLFHEAAHGVQMEIYKSKVKPHGKEWKEILSILQNHPYNVKNDPSYGEYLNNIKPRKYKKIEYKCRCNKSHFLTLIRHNRVKNGVVYRCAKCKQILVEKE